MTARIGVAGLGHWGPNLARNFAALGALEAVCEPDEARREAISANLPGVHGYARFEDLLADSSIDAISIATPAASHGALVCRAIAAGKHVLVEKPLCLDPDEGARLAAQAKEAKRVLMVGHLLLYHPAYRALRDVVHAGQIGDLRYVYSNRLSLGKIRREENALWSFAPHDISMILDLIGEMPVRASANGGTYLAPPVADTSLTHLTFGAGTQAHIFVSWLHPFKEHRTVVIGSEGMIVFDDVRPGVEKLLLYPHAVGWQGNLPSVEKAAALPIPYDKDEPLAVECAHFLECIATGTEPLSNAGEALNVLRVLSACQDSLSRGEPIALEATSP